MSESEMDKNLAYVKKDFATLLNLYRNKYILVYKQQVVSSFDTYETAAQEGVENYGIDGGFLVYYMVESEIVNFVSIATI